MSCKNIAAVETMAAEDFVLVFQVAASVIFYWDVFTKRWQNTVIKGMCSVGTRPCVQRAKRCNVAKIFSKYIKTCCKKHKQVPQSWLNVDALFRASTGQECPIIAKQTIRALFLLKFQRSVIQTPLLTIKMGTEIIKEFCQTSTTNWFEGHLSYVEECIWTQEQNEAVSARPTRLAVATFSIAATPQTLCYLSLSPYFGRCLLGITTTT